MESDDEVNEETSFDPTFATAGPRRSTFTPPPGSTTTPPTPTAAVHDDDELANALAADLGRFGSGTVPGADTPAPVPVQKEPTVFDLDEVPAGAAVPDTAPTAPVERVDPLEPIADAAPVAEPVAPVQPDFEFAPPPAPETMAVSDAPAPPPWSSLPAPDPAQAVELPDPDPEPADVAEPVAAAESSEPVAFSEPASVDGPPQRPVRRSLSAEELLTVGADQDAGSRIEQLEAQLRLRDQEAREFAAWENSMLALGTPDAVAAVEQARAEFTDVVAPPTGAFPVIPSPAVHDVAVEQPAVAVEPDEPLTSAAYEPPTLTGSAPVVAAAAYEVIDEDTADVPVVDPPADLLAEPVAADEVVSPPLPAWDIPAPSATWDPEPWEPPAAAPVVDISEPESEPVVVPELIDPSVDEPETSSPIDADIVDAEIVEPEPQSADEPGAELAVEAPGDPLAAFLAEPESPLEPESTFAPPALVEPPPFGGPPILPSEAASLPPLVDSVPDFSAPVDVVEAEVVEEPVPPVSVEDAPFAFGTAPATPSREFSFDDLLSGASEELGGEEPPLRRDPEPATESAAGPESLFIEPMPVSAGESVPTETGSVAIVEPAYEEELDDDVDETDRVPLAAAAAATLPPPISPPSGPISTVRVPEDQTVILDKEPVSPPAFRVERASLEPTPVDQRVGRAARLFWLWFAANSSVISLGLGATVFGLGMSLRQAIVAVLAGVALSFIPLGLTTLAGKRSGQPTMVVSRATFGHLGNVLPALVALVGRVFWGAVLLWLIASAITVVLVGGQISGPFGEAQLLLISLAVAFVIAVLIAFTGYGLIARIQLVLSILSAVLVVGFIALTAQYVDVAQALTVPDSSWLLAVTGGVLVFSVIGLAWANSGGDLARYQRPEASGGGSMLWATFGATLPSFLLIAYGALLAASDPGIASGLALSPLDTLAGMLPLWYPIPLLAATTLSLLSGVVISLYSGGFALQSLGLRVGRQWSVVIVSALLAVLAAIVTLGVTGGLAETFRDAATTLAVPTAAWAGIFAAETMIRNRRFESESLVQRGGVYPDWRWGNVIGFVFITAIGYGLTTATVAWLGWQGYLFTLLGVPLDSDLAGTDAGVLVALLLGILLPIVIGIPAIRKQEETRVP